MTSTTATNLPGPCRFPDSKLPPRVHVRTPRDTHTHTLSTHTDDVYLFVLRYDTNPFRLCTHTKTKNTLIFIPAFKKTVSTDLILTLIILLECAYKKQTCLQPDTQVDRKFPPHDTRGACSCCQLCKTAPHLMT
jgi:hypothetical protein